MSSDSLVTSEGFYALATFEQFYMKSKSLCCAHGVSIKWAGGAIRNLGRIQIGQLALSLQYTGGSWGGGQQKCQLVTECQTNKFIIKTYRNQQSELKSIPNPMTGKDIPNSPYKQNLSIVYIFVEHQCCSISVSTNLFVDLWGLDAKQFAPT